jgi:carboxylate-amine ligase
VTKNRAFGQACHPFARHKGFPETGSGGRIRGGEEATTDALTFGVEEEYLIVDRRTRALASCSNKLVNEAAPVMGETVSAELNLCQIEIASGVCNSVPQLRDDLRTARTGLAAAAAEHDRAIIASGTHPFSSWKDQRVNIAFERYARMEDRYQVVARQQVICGCHVHVGIDDDDLAIEVMNRSTPWLPTLLALSANSPYWHGVDTGFASYRTQVWQRWPTSGMPPHVADRAEYDAVIEELERVDAIEDATHIYWYVRPSARYPTVEFRPCDVCLDVDDALLVAALVRAIAWTCARDARAGAVDRPHRREILEAAMWRAARYGLGGALVDVDTGTTQPAMESVRRLLAHVTDGLEQHGDLEFATRGIAAIVRRGNGSERQRRERARTADPTAVVDLLVAETLRFD